MAGLFVRVWEYDVAESHRAEFERVYGSAGDWAQLFALAAGILGTELYCSATAGRYLIVDRFASRAAWETFLAEHRDADRALDERCSALTSAERVLAPLGSRRSVYIFFHRVWSVDNFSLYSRAFDA